MAHLKPFKALRPRPEYAPALAAPPYDVFSRKEAAEYTKTHPGTFLRIDRPETMFPDSTDMYSREVYEKGAQTLAQWTAGGIYMQEDIPCFYIYELASHEHTQTGIVGCTLAADFENGMIKTHEKTRKDKAEDRIRHISTLNVQASPVFLTYRNSEKTSGLADKFKTQSPLYCFTGEDGISHTIWRLFRPEDIESVTQCFRQTDSFYVADGHHRAASGTAVAKMRNGSGDSGHILSILFPDSQLKISPYHRIIQDSQGQDEDTLLKKISEKCIVKPAGKAFFPSSPHEIGMYFHGKWYILKAMEKFLTQDPVEGLDTAFLQREILKPVLGIKDPRTDRRIRFAGGLKDPLHLSRTADNTKDGIAFSMYPVSMEDFFRVADAGLLMPPKSTWFEPKPLSGLFLHRI